MATTMLTSTPTKEKKKNSSPNKQNRSTVAGTLKVISLFKTPLIHIKLYIFFLEKSKI
jgi:hypothetical protein